MSHHKDMAAMAWQVRKACLKLRKAALDAELVLAAVDAQLAAITPKVAPKARPKLSLVDPQEGC